MPFLTTRRGRSVPLLGHRPTRAPRRSWTSPRLTDGITTTERGIINAIHRAGVQTIASFNPDRVVDEGSLAAMIDGFLPASLDGAYRDRIISTVQRYLLEEIVMAAAESLGGELAGISIEEASTLARTYKDLQTRAELSGLPLPSQLTMPIPPSYPPPPANWLRVGGPSAPRAWFDLRLDLVNPYAVEYASTAAYNLAGKLTRDTIDSVRATITMGYQNGWTVEEMADLISQKVGLFPRWSRAVDNYYNALRAKGVDGDFARKQMATYAARLRDKRGMMIARTETMRASNFGRLSSWNAMGSAGLLDTRNSFKQWMTGPHVEQSQKVNRSVTGPCDICAPMDGVKVKGVDGQFFTPNGLQVLAPPAHPHCRCTVLIVPPEPPTWEEMGGEVQWLQVPEEFS